MPKSFLKELHKTKKRKKPNRFYRALFRNLNEIRTAILERRALIGIESVGSKQRLNFFTLSYDALFNDMVAHTIKVLDKNPDSATFWYLYRCDSKIIDSFIEDKSYDLKSLEYMADKLKIVRDKTHFHIDKKGVLNPKNIWKEADISGKEFGKALEQVFDILQYLRKIHLGKEFAMPEYNGSDASKLITIAKRDGIIPNFGDGKGS